MSNEKKYASIRIYEDTKNLIDEIYVESGWVTLETYDQKIKHLIWHYSHYKNNNK